MSSRVLPNAFDVERTAPLVLRLQQQDPAALGEVYDLYGKIVFTTVLRLVRDEGIAEDLVQETFLCLWRRADLFDVDRGPLGPWLLAVARNRALDHLRTVNRNQTRLQLERNEPNQSITFPPGDPLLSGAMKKLSANQRIVIHLAFYEGYSQSEISAKLGHPLGTVKTWARTALKALRDDLELPCRLTQTAV